MLKMPHPDARKHVAAVDTLGVGNGTSVAGATARLTTMGGTSRISGLTGAPLVGGKRRIIGRRWWHLKARARRHRVGSYGATPLGRNPSHVVLATPRHCYQAPP